MGAAMKADRVLSQGGSRSVEEARRGWLFRCESIAQATPREWGALDQRYYDAGLEVIDAIAAAVRAEQPQHSASVAEAMPLDMARSKAILARNAWASELAYQSRELARFDLSKLQKLRDEADAAMDAFAAAVRAEQQAEIERLTAFIETVTPVAERLAAMQSRAESAERERDALKAALQEMLASAYPSEVLHPTMWAAWESARAALRGAQEQP